MNHLLAELPKSSLNQTISQISHSLQTIAPTNPNLSETTQLINYALLAMAIVGLALYHYIKNHEDATN